MNESTSNPSLATALADSGSLSPQQLELVFAAIVSQVGQLHREGRIHGAIQLRNISLDGNQQPRLSPPAETVDLQSDTESDELFPPELKDFGIESLSTELAAAQRICAEQGLTFDPRRIDLYQLGVLLCRLSSRGSLGSYLRSPKARGQVAPGLRPVIDQALGYDAENRFQDCEQLAAAFHQATHGAESTSESDTPASGSLLVGDDSLDTPPTGHPAPKSSRSPAAPGALPFEQFGPYQILERIGAGGMGDVYKAYDPSLKRHVAIKVLPAELARNTDFVHRFHNEAMAIGQLAHPNVVHAYGRGEEDGRYYFVMQFVEGESLAGLLRRRKKLTPEETRGIVVQCLAGLGAAHKRNLIHRDIKPGNILLDHEQHRALVADFGLVKTCGGEESLTVTGVIMGTVDYISPEQARGQRLDARSDLYSIGVLMYQMLAGRLPFVSESPTGMIFQHAFEQPSPLRNIVPQIPSGLADLVMKLMAKKPEDRYQSAKEVLEVLQALDLVPQAESEPRLSGVSAASIIAAPVGDWSASAPFLSSNAPSAEPWGKVRRVARWFRSRAVQIREDGTTEQQLDKAVAEYERRRQDLSGLMAEAEAVVDDLRNQIETHRQAAETAGLRAVAVGDPETAQRARQEQAECQLTADEFATLLAQQEVQLEAFRTQLGQVNAVWQKLRSEREILRARLQIARAQIDLSDPRSTAKTRMFPKLGVATAGVVAASIFLAVASWVVRDEPRDATLLILPTSTPRQDAGKVVSPEGEKKAASPPETIPQPLIKPATPDPKSNISFGYQWRWSMFEGLQDGRFTTNALELGKTDHIVFRRLDLSNNNRSAEIAGLRGHVLSIIGEGKTVARVLVTEIGQQDDASEYLDVFCDYLGGTGNRWSTTVIYTIQSEGPADTSSQSIDLASKSHPEKLEYDWRWRPYESMNNGTFTTGAYEPSTSGTVVIRRLDFGGADRRRSLINLKGQTLRMLRKGATVARFLLLSSTGEDGDGNVGYYCKYLDGTNERWIYDAVYRIELDPLASSPAARAISNP